ncbi:hypothetical protein SAMN05444339_104154 [Loktanella atrilutea]|uniref:Uncharacterized protein n=1 Tax=Loktanella atrilutea TaxID=366533 RepID=A0A1M4ZWF8_LOKAT|nr:hypothetical protein [Loktanella atrilutea]SHF22331.1 hypothetical protein SAMN05444339_104154 [Loktanella atrilutea]
MKVTPESLEGRLMAQRQVLARLVQAADPAVRQWLRDKSEVQVPEEDPGVGDASGAFAIEASLADEMRLILEAAERHRQG